MNKAEMELKKAQDMLNKMMERAHNKRVGFEPKCKICTSKHVIEIEKMRREGSTYGEIKTYLNDESNENVSLMSLSRHFNQHYAQKLRYINENRKEEEKLLQDGEKDIQSAIKYSPELKEIMDENYTIYDKPIYDSKGNFIKWNTYEKTGRERFILECGYCFTGNRFCNFVPKKELYYFEDMNSKFNREISDINTGKIRDPYGEKKANLLDHRLDCLDCKIDDANNNDFVVEALIHLITKKLIGKPMSRKQFLNLLNDDCDYDLQFLEEEIEKQKIR